jgi:hypothetical protein
MFKLSARSYYSFLLYITFRGLNDVLYRIWTPQSGSAAVSHPFDAHLDTACHSDADPDHACNFNADPDPTFHFDADPIRILASK